MSDLSTSFFCCLIQVTLPENNPCEWSISEMFFEVDRNEILEKFGFRGFDTADEEKEFHCNYLFKSSLLLRGFFFFSILNLILERLCSF